MLKPNPPYRRVGAALVGLAVLVALFLFMGRADRGAGVRGMGDAGDLARQGEGQGQAKSAPGDDIASGVSSDAANTGDDAALPVDDASGVRAGASATDEGHDPPPQPRAFFSERLSDDGPAGRWALDGIAVGPGGASLSAQRDALNPRRVGRVESEAIPTDFPANFISPLYRATEPEGTSITMEMAASANGQTWSPWYEMARDADAQGQIRETFPDGRPNPNYGYIPSGMLTFGLKTVTFFKYRLTLYSETEQSPTVSAVRVFYQDTTLGQGSMAEF